MALPPPPVPVVLPLQGDPLPLLDAVAELAARWPEHVDARLVVPTAPLGARDRALLAELGDDVLVVEVPEHERSYGALVAAAVGDDRALVLDPAQLPATDDLLALAEGRAGHGGVHVAAADLAVAPVLTAAADLPSLAALLTVLAPRQEAPGPPAPAAVPALDPAAPVRPGLVSVVLVVRNGLDRTRACVAALRRTTRRPFEVVVVDDGSTDGTRSWLAGQRDLVVLTNAVGRGAVAARNQGIAASRGEHLVLLDPATTVPRFWVEGLLRAFAVDPRVAAVGPCSSTLPGAQRAVAQDGEPSGDPRSAADAWRRRHAGRTSEVAHLDGGCLALRRSALLDVGGLDEGYRTAGLAADDVCRRLRGADWSLRVAAEVLVHADAPAVLPDAEALRADRDRHRASPAAGDDVFLSAALIVKDEQRALPRCLASLRGVVDEVVVCDTGSTDRTVEVAEAFGARVVSAPWQGDFAAARNSVLAACRGTWVLSVDADEQLGAEPDADLRLVLLALPSDAATLPVRSRSDEQGGATFEHQAGRLFRRGHLSWVGAVHETLVDERSGRPPGYVAAAGLWLDHDGYVGRVYEERDKTSRNLLLAEKDHEQALAAGDSARRWKTAYELARALSKQDGHEQRVEELLTAALEEMPPAVAHLRCDAHVRLATALARQDRLAEAETAARTALEASPGDAAALLALGQVLAVAGRHAEALAAVDAPAAGSAGDAVRDLAKQEVDLPLLRARLLHRLGRDAEAAQVLSALAALHPTAVDWPLLAVVLRDRAEALAQLVARSPQAALAALDELPAADRQALHAALGALGVDAASHSPAALRAARLDRVLHGHDAASVAQAALALEDEDLLAALELWRRLPAGPPVQAAQARCLLQLGRVEDAVEAVEGLDPVALEPADLLVVAAVAGAAGDRGTAQLLLDALGDVPPDLRERVDGLTHALGLVG